MPWIAVDLDDTLVMKDIDPLTGEEAPMPVMGAVEAMNELLAEGHRVTVYTSRFAPMPDSMRINMKKQIEEELASLGSPPLEVWSGTTKPSADIFIGDKNVTFDQDWGLALAQAQTMLEEKGLIDIPPDDGVMNEAEVDPNQPMPEEMQ